MLPDDQPTIPTAPPNGSRPAPIGWQAPSVEEMQAMLPQYEIMEILGRGGMGAVYKGRQKSLKRLVAIKILPLGMADDEMKFAERFQNEAQTMAAMNHPAIVSVYDFGETPDGLLYFIMEFVDGTDVQKMIQASGRLSGEYALAITAHVCDALSYAHKRGVIHRDIKPANILIDQEGHIKVADFGLAKMNDPAQTSGLTKTNMAMGTPDYVAPEVLVTGMVADHRADIYAVGVMLYQMLTGEVPRGMFKLPSQKGIGSDMRFDQIICKAMEQDREERYQSAMDVRRDLDVILTTPQPKDDGKGVVSASQIPQKPVAKQPRPPGERSQPPAQKPAPQQAPAQKAAAAPKAKAPPKKQSPATMWLSIGGIVAVLGVAGFLVLGGKPKPQASATTDKASATAPSAKPQPPIKVRENPNVSAADSGKPSAATALEAGAIKLYASADQLPVRSGVSWDNGAVRLDKNALVYPGLHSRDAILRAEIKMNPDRSSPRLSLRHPGSGNSKGLIYSVMTHGKDGTIKFDFTDASGGIKLLQEWSLPRRYGADEWMTLELRAVGDEFTVSADGNVLGTVRDSTHEEAGTASLWANANGFFRNIVFVPLDNPVPTPGKGKLIDLLALVDVKRDAIAGEWERTTDGLVKKGIGTTSEGAPRLQLPYEPPEEYDFEIEFTPTTGTQSLGQMIAAQSRMFSWIISGGRPGEPMTGFEMFESKATSTPSEVSKRMDGELVNGRRYRSRVEVRAGSLRGFLDDKEIVNWSGKLQRLALDAPSRLRDDGHLGLRSVRQTTFHKITVREVTGTGKVDAGTATTSSVSANTIDLLPFVDPSRDAVVGKWSQSANGLSVAAGDHTTAGKGSLRLQLPYQPPEEYDFEIEFTASAATGRTLGQILSASARNFSLLWGAGAESQPLAGFEVLDGLTIGRQTTTTKPLPGGIESGRRYRSRVEVRRDSMRAFLDDKEVISWKGSFSSLSIDEQTRLRDELHLGLRTSRPVTYHKITVREVSGAGKVEAGVATSSSATATAKTVDLLPLVDVKRDMIGGEWSRDGGDLVVKATKPDANGTPRLQLPYQPPEEYDFEIEFTPESGTNMVGQALSAYQRSFAWFLDAQLTAGNKAGFNEIEGVHLANRTDGTTMRTKFLTNGQRHRSTIEVRRTGVRALLDGETLVKWGNSPKSYERLEAWKGEKLRDALHLGLFAYDRAVRFHKVTVREITGTGKVDAPQAAASPASYPPGTEKIDWLTSAAWKEPWSLKNGRLSTATGKTRYFGVGRDATVRMRFREATAPESKEPPLQISFRGGPNGGAADRMIGYLLQIYPAQKHVQLLFMKRDPRTNVDVPEFLWKDQPFPASDLSNGDMELELRVIGQDLSLWSGSTQIAAIRDARAQSGAWVLSGSPGVEITALETSGITPNPGTISPPQAGNAPPQISNWRDVTDESREKAKSIPGMIVDAQGISWDGTGYKMRLPLPQAGQRDQAISVRYTGQAQLDLRISPGGFIYVLAQPKQTIFQGQLAGVTEPVKLATTQPHPADFDPERPHELLLTMEGKRVRVWLDGRFVSEGNVDAYPEGESGLMVMRNSVVHQIKVANLQNNNQTAPKWTDWLGPKLAAGDFATNGWSRSTNGVTTEREISGLRLLPPGTKNAAVRVTYVLQDSQGLMLNARERMDGKVRLGYCVIDKVTQLHLNRLKPDGRNAALQHVTLPAEPDRVAERTLEMRMIGNQLKATLNGTFAGTATDDTLSEGEWTLVFMKGVLVKKVEVQPLDAAP